MGEEGGPPWVRGSFSPSPRVSPKLPFSKMPMMMMMPLAATVRILQQTAPCV